MTLLTAARSQRHEVDADGFDGANERAMVRFNASCARLGLESIEDVVIDLKAIRAAE